MAAAFDPLDMSNYKIEKLPKMQKSGFEMWMARLGAPLALIVFVVLYWFVKIPFIENISADALDNTALARYNVVGAENFIRINYAMLAIFAASIVLWITEAIPNYLTSLIVILAIVLCHVTSEKTAFAQLGHPVMWLNILSFILASMLVKTQVAKRFALWFMVKYGKTPAKIILSFIVINLVLSAFISATTAKATILLPIFMVIAAIYGATGGDKRNNFGRNLVLQNLFQINIGASGFMTGSGANLLAVSLMVGAMGGQIFSYQDWFIAAFPLAVILILIGWFVGTKIIFPLKPEERKPQLEGGMERMKEELAKMGKMGWQEYKAIAIFVTVLVLWATDKQHGISQTTVAFAGAVVALLPKIGVVKWNDVDIPWHLMLFSAGAYVLGVGLDATGIAGTLVNAGFDSLGVNENTPFGVLFLLLTFLMLFSAIIFQSKTMRALIFIPIALGVEQRFGFPGLSLAFPVALLIEHVYVLPFNSKPAALLYTTNQYSWSDSFKFGFTMMVISWIMIIIWGETVLRWLGYTNGIFF
ncbi:MAG: DASS family sodium-coupled anion symporter [Bacteroidales bacterium]|jgi:solute carrier family 13 (sodium-dependent dicarboxylate transporter), member 2/3/5|nr:DASS family sodium-coupled anion symporter [Bacteroidales bacterium]MDD2204225.1 DASS family sodium-coupled anion symporter [Bacteroidales bacterium]MDD3913602.1 DASS family sodium-coupled anion symporter [Bacteroidales bacterium]MDD4633630.1 DASS family sodium-coupled anion symporter [Bacteroidales bacterium]